MPSCWGLMAQSSSEVTCTGIQGNGQNRLKLLRQQTDELSQQQLADMVGCSRQTIISIES